MPSLCYPFSRASYFFLLAIAMALLGCSDESASPAPGPDPVVYRSIQAESGTPCEGLPGCEGWVTRGDPKTGAAETLFRFKAGTVFAKHWHTSPEHVVGISGTMIWNVEGTGPHDVGAGDYLYYPSRAIHWGQCAPAADCVFFVYDDQAYDIHAAE
ncbi:cupin domain-containing protein [Pendulispora albinea]|uniref:Cupin domain-containing protein n=1 Tax=Pendulispora albinea TaxID=2741071 RepID=A0ABZ2M9H4_9BACT